ncbi:MAG: hypothetical protein LBS92_00290 [Candidatus Methanoplasma sp.]|nr:hypothetical protein [Candidatus Methanoplasma sp.]
MTKFQKSVPARACGRKAKIAERRLLMAAIMIAVFLSAALAAGFGGGGGGMA